MLVGAMPIYIGIGVEIFSYLVCSLCENVRPKLLNIHFVLRYFKLSLLLILFQFI